jgi:multicomponent Na+:H+ antiporter subunit D
MALTAALCVAIGVFPGALYGLLPNSDVKYEPYTFSHTIVQLQLVAFVALAFTRAVKIGFLPKVERSTIIDFDWTYRRLLPAIIRGLRLGIGTLWGNASYNINTRLNNLVAAVFHLHGPHGPFARTWPTGAMVMMVALLLGMTLVLTYL